MSALLEWALDPAGMTPHGFCLAWSPTVVWLYVAGNLMIAAAYAAIPVMVARFAWRRRDLREFRGLLALCAAFVWGCGLTHWMMIATLWRPWYGLSALVTVATGVVSLLTAWKMRPLLRAALDIPSPGQLAEALARAERGEALYRAMFLESPACKHALDADGVVIGVSDRWAEFMGWRPEEVVGRPFTDFLTVPGAEFFRAHWPRYVARGTLDGARMQMVKRDGTVAEVRVSARVMRGPDGSFLRSTGVVTDVTDATRAEEERARTEDRLRQSQKMEAIGLLTGGIAHDFNNMLQAIMGSGQMLLRALDRDEMDRPRFRRLLGNLLDAGAKGAGLTQKLLSFARRQRLDPVVFDPEEVLRGLDPLIRTALGDAVAVEWDVARGVGVCFADRNQLETAVLNLVNNARDAIRQAQAEDEAAGRPMRQGVVTLCLRAVPWVRFEGGPECPPSREYVRISVRDNGAGFAPEVRAHAFEPFVTTKRDGQGTGLGLAQLHGFAWQSGGFASIDGAAGGGGGAEVSIHLPRQGDGLRRLATAAAAGVACAAAAAADAAAGAAGHGERLLVVEDEPMVRATLAEMLEDAGFVVEQAENADEALSRLRDPRVREGLSAVLTDMVMPGSMDGLALAGLVRREWPGLPVLLVTANLNGPRAALPQGVRYLPKPYSRDQLLLELRGRPGECDGMLPDCPRAAAVAARAAAAAAASGGIAGAVA
jgi:PAS domain S-box-containing protein